MHPPKASDLIVSFDRLDFRYCFAVAFSGCRPGVVPQKASQQSTSLFTPKNGAAMYLAKVYEKFVHQFAEVFENQ
jgi:hypothetical protein